jgi:hypothetical protein
MAEEIEDMGRNQLDAVQDLLTKAMLHDLKAEAWPLSPDAPSWRADARVFTSPPRVFLPPDHRLVGDCPFCVPFAEPKSGRVASTGKPALPSAKLKVPSRLPETGSLAGKRQSGRDNRCRCDRGHRQQAGSRSADRAGCRRQSPRRPRPFACIRRVLPGID